MAPPLTPNPRQLAEIILDRYTHGEAIAPEAWAQSVGLDPLQVMTLEAALEGYPGEDRSGFISFEDRHQLLADHFGEEFIRTLGGSDGTLALRRRADFLAGRICSRGPLRDLPSSEERRASALELEEIGDVASLHETDLWPCLRAETDPRILASLLLTMAREFSRGEIDTNPLQSFLRHPTLEVRIAAISALGCLAPSLDATLPTLLQINRSESDSSIHEAVLNALANLYQTFSSEDPSPEVFEMIFTDLASLDADRREGPQRLLGVLGTRAKSLAPRLLELFRSGASEYLDLGYLLNTWFEAETMLPILRSWINLENGEWYETALSLLLNSEGPIPSDLLSTLRTRLGDPETESFDRNLILQILLRHDPENPDNTEMLTTALQNAADEGLEPLLDLLMGFRLFGEAAHVVAPTLREMLGRTGLTQALRIQILAALADMHRAETRDFRQLTQILSRDLNWRYIDEDGRSADEVLAEIENIGIILSRHPEAAEEVRSVMSFPPSLRTGMSRSRGYWMRNHLPASLVGEFADPSPQAVAFLAGLYRRSAWDIEGSAGFSRDTALVALLRLAERSETRIPELVAALQEIQRDDLPMESEFTELRNPAWGPYPLYLSRRFSRLASPYLRAHLFLSHGGLNRRHVIENALTYLESLPANP